MLNPKVDPTKQAWHDWILHLLGSEDCAAARGNGERKILEGVLEECCVRPGYWGVKLAESILEHAEFKGKEEWGVVVRAARGEDGWDAGCGEGDGGVKEKKRKRGKVEGDVMTGPRKFVGLWKPRPIGWVPEGWEDDE